MKIAEVSIRRPVFAAMMIAALVVFGVVLYGRLSVDLYPKVDFPIVTVTVIYPGASPGTMETKVADPVEEATASLAGIRSLKSTSLESVAQVMIQFELGVDLDTATQDVRDRVASIQGELPEGAEAPVVQKLDLGAAPIMKVAISGSGDPAELADYAKNVFKPGVERVKGAGQVQLIGAREREFHVYVMPERLRSYGMTIHTVSRAISSQNIDLPAGRISSAGRELVLRTDAEATSVADLGALILQTRNGATVRLRDVARVVDGLEEARSRAPINCT